MAKLGSRASYGGTVVENVSAAKTLDPSDSGKVFTLDLDGTFSITLPTAAQAGAGWTARFICSDTGSGTVKVIPNSAEDTLIGMIVYADGAAAESAETGVDEPLAVIEVGVVMFKFACIVKSPTGIELGLLGS